MNLMKNVITMISWLYNIFERWADKDITTRIRKAQHTLAILRPVWHLTAISSNTKHRILCLNVENVLLFRSDNDVRRLPQVSEQRRVTSTFRSFSTSFSRTLWSDFAITWPRDLMLCCCHVVKRSGVHRELVRGRNFGPAWWPALWWWGVLGGGEKREKNCSDTLTVI